MATYEVEVSTTQPTPQPGVVSWDPVSPWGWFYLPQNWTTVSSGPSVAASGDPEPVIEYVYVPVPTATPRPTFGTLWPRSS